MRKNWNFLWKRNMIEISSIYLKKPLLECENSIFLLNTRFFIWYFVVIWRNFFSVIAFWQGSEFQFWWILAISDSELQNLEKMVNWACRIVKFFTQNLSGRKLWNFHTVCTYNFHQIDRISLLLIPHNMKITQSALK